MADDTREEAPWSEEDERCWLAGHVRAAHHERVASGDRFVPGAVELREAALHVADEEQVGADSGTEELYRRAWADGVVTGWRAKEIDAEDREP